MIDLTNESMGASDNHKQVVQSAKPEENNMSENTLSMVKAKGALEKHEVNPIDDLERVLQEFEKKSSDEEGDLQNEGNLTRLVDKK